VTARLTDVCEAIAVQAGARTAYPVAAADPGFVGMDGPYGVVHATSGTVELQGGSEQRWLDTVRLDFYCSLGKLTPQVVAAIRALPERLADAFAPGETTAAYRLGGLVNRCALVGYEFGTVDRAGAEYWVGRFTFDVKRHRFAGE
jgi:hypothetical protein